MDTNEVADVDSKLRKAVARRRVCVDDGSDGEGAKAGSIEGDGGIGDEFKGGIFVGGAGVEGECQCEGE